MSAIGDRMRKRDTDRRYRESHPRNEEQLAKHAAEEREYRRRKRVAESLEHDELAAAEARAGRVTKRLSAMSTGAAEAFDGECEEDADNEGVDDDFDEVPTDDDNEEAGEWSDERVKTVFLRCRRNDRYMHGETGHAVAQFDDMFERVRVVLSETRYDGGKRVQAMHRQQRLSDQLQFFMLLVWLWQVSRNCTFRFFISAEVSHVQTNGALLRPAEEVFGENHLPMLRCAANGGAEHDVRARRSRKTNARSVGRNP